MKWKIFHFNITTWFCDVIFGYYIINTGNQDAFSIGYANPRISIRIFPEKAGIFPGKGNQQIYDNFTKSKTQMSCLKLEV